MNLTQQLLYSIAVVISLFFWHKRKTMEKPTIFEKNNLPISVRKKYCEVIEKYQLIQHYENGIIQKDKLILELLKENKEDNCKHKNITHVV